MANWVRVGSIIDFPPETAREVVAADRIVAIFHVGGEFYALDGICPHQGGPLGQGVLTGCVVTCPWHGWQFDVRTGQHQINATLTHPRFDVMVDGDNLLVDVSRA